MNSSLQMNFNDLKLIWPIVRRRKWLIILPWLLVSGLVLGGTYLMTPMYETSAIVSFNSEVQLSDEFERILGLRRDRLDAQSIYNEITSSRYVAALNDRLQMDQEAWLVESVEAIAIRTPTVPLREITMQLLRDKIKGQVEITQVARSQIRIRVESSIPSEAVLIANTLGEVFISERKKASTASIRTPLNWADLELQRAEQQLQEKIDQRTEFQREMQALQLDDAILTDANRTAIAADKDQTDIEVEQYREDERGILRQLDQKSDLTTHKLTLEDSAERTRLKNNLREQLEGTSDLAHRYVWSDPQVLQSKLRQNQLINSIEDENRKSVARQYADQSNEVQVLLNRLFNTRSNIDYLYAKSSFIASALEELTTIINMIPEYQNDLTRMNEDIKAKTDTRDRFRRQQESSTISQTFAQDVAASKIKIIQPAATPLAPFKPDRAQIVAMGFILGLLIGCTAAAIMELMDNSYKRVEDITDELGLPVLGIAPSMPFLKKLTK